MGAQRRHKHRKAKRTVDVSPEAVTLRIDVFIARTEGWGTQMLQVCLPDDQAQIAVFAGPTHDNAQTQTNIPCEFGDVVTSQSSSTSTDWIDCDQEKPDQR